MIMKLWMLIFVYYKQNNLKELKNMIQKQLPLSIEYNI